MTAAQALTPGLTGPASAGRSSSKGGSGTERGDASFRDALDGASKGAAEAAPGSRERAQSKSDQESGDVDATVTPVAQDAGGTLNPPVTPMQAARDVTGVRAGAGEGSVATTSLMQRLQAAMGHTDATAESGTPDEAGPWLPGQVDEDSETFDAARLLAIMRAQGAQGVSNAGGGATVVTVLGQERHLALGGLPGELAVQLADEQTGVSTVLRDGTSAAALSAQADPGADGVERARGKAGGDDVRLATEPGVGRGRALFAAEERGQSGSGPGEHGQDGRQQEGRSSSGNNGQPASGVFASTMQNPGLQAANAARGGYGTPGAHDPVSDQIASRVRADLAAEGTGETSSSDGVVKVLNIELKPANLGAVTLRMSLKDNVITLHVETQNAETRALIEREQAKLTSTLSAAGYTVESITAIQSDGLRTSGVAAQGDPNSPAAFQQPGSQGQGASEFSGEGRSGRSSPGGGEPHSQSGGKDDSAAAINRGVDGVYV